MAFGAGVSGMTAAYGLSHRFHVTVFEAGNYWAGTRTHAMSPQGTVRVSPSIWAS
ncbi:NAD(P)-binding protein [Streptomyces sp. NPDC051662]|uniref:NAD(P)-binding protein n=1 Tax=Streptomyces sp. NPDC051662 TaxID=3154750 RepID=UPI003439AD30